MFSIRLSVLNAVIIILVIINSVVGVEHKLSIDIRKIFMSSWSILNKVTFGRDDAESDATLEFFEQVFLKTSFYRRLAIKQQSNLQQAFTVRYRQGNLLNWRIN